MSDLKTAPATERASVEDLVRQRDEWKNIALYLADCHAASAEIIAHRKSSPKVDRKRIASLCAKAAEMIRAARSYGYARRSEATVLERLDAAASPPEEGL